MKNKFSRRDFLNLSQKLFLDTFLLGVSGSLYSVFIEPLWFDVTYLSLQLPKLNKAFTGFKILQISDIHAGEQFMPNRLGDVIEKILEIQPDVVVITGDFVDSSEHMTREILDETGIKLKQISQLIPSFAVMGNHDHWWDVKQVRQMLKDTGIIELENNFYTLTQNGHNLHICGVDDFWVKKSDLGRIISNLPDDECAILLAHEPDFADKSSAHHRFDLQLSGHSHGGQVVIPFYGPLSLPRHGRKYHTGLYQINNMYQYTNRGIGMASPYVRFNCRPEITVFTLYSLDE